MSASVERKRKTQQDDATKQVPCAKRNTMEQIKKVPRRIELQPCTMPWQKLIDDEVIDPLAVELIETSRMAPEIGKAVVARQNFEPGETICSYGGDIITMNQYKQLRKHHRRGSPRVSYFLSIDDDLSVDGYPELLSASGHAGNYINDARSAVPSATASS